MPRPIFTWHGFVGQRDIVASLAEHARGAVQKAETLPHVLLGGQSGVGKTHLAKAVAADMQTGFHEFCCSRQAKKIDVAEKLAGVKKGDIVFIPDSSDTSVYVLGAVTKPGSYRLTPRRTVCAAFFPCRIFWKSPMQPSATGII